MPTNVTSDLLSSATDHLSEADNIDTRPIGIFDSGIGGLSITKCISEQMPHENLLYVADTLHAPYGEKSTTFIQQRVYEIAQWFIANNAKAIVVACNTATVNAIIQLRQVVSIPIIGVEPAIKPAVNISLHKKIALLVTKATAENKRFLHLVEQYKNDSEVYIQACPGLVELIEQGKKSSVDCRAMLSEYLRPLLDKGVDTIVLGCTHYPLVKELISELCGDNVVIMETALPVTEQLQRQLALHQLLNNSISIGSISFYSSNNCLTQQQLFSNIWQFPLTLHKLA